MSVVDEGERGERGGDGRSCGVRVRGRGRGLVVWGEERRDVGAAGEEGGVCSSSAMGEWGLGGVTGEGGGERRVGSELGLGGGIVSGGGRGSGGGWCAWVM